MQPCFTLLCYAVEVALRFDSPHCHTLLLRVDGVLDTIRRLSGLLGEVWGDWPLVRSSRRGALRRGEVCFISERCASSRRGLLRLGAVCFVSERCASSAELGHENSRLVGSPGVKRHHLSIHRVESD